MNKTTSSIEERSSPGESGQNPEKQYFDCLICSQKIEEPEGYYDHHAHFCEDHSKKEQREYIRKQIE